MSALPSLAVPQDEFLDAGARDSTSPWRTRRTRFLAVALILAAVAAYLPAITAGFIWDDGLLLTANPNMSDASGLTKIWLGKQTCDYTPLTLTTFWLETRLWNDAPAGYHIVNIVLHAAAAVLLWRILAILGIPGAFLAGMLFAIHPVNVASVAWIAERKNTLSGALYFASILAFLTSSNGTFASHNQFPKNRRTTTFYILSICLFLLAGLSKGAVATMPVVLCLCILWMHEKITRRDLLRLLPFVIVAAAVSLLTIRYQSRAMDYGLVPTSFAFRVARAGVAVWSYLGGIFFPIGLSPMVPQWYPDLSSPLVYLPGALAVGMLVLLFWKRKSWGRPLLFGYCYYLVVLFPVLGFVWMTLQQETPCADWWQYLATPGIFALVAAGLARNLVAANKYTRLGGQTLLCLVFALLFFQTWRRNEIYHSMETYCRAVLAENPHAWSIQTDLGVVLKERQEFEQAITCHRQALRDNPRFMEAHNNLGNALNAVGDWKGAEGEFLEALATSPSNPDVLGNLADAYFLQGKISDALAAEASAIKADRYNPQRYVEFSAKLSANGQFEQAVVCLNNAMLLAPSDIGIQVNLVQTLIAAGRYDDATVVSTQALQTATETGNRESIEKMALLQKRCQTAAR